MSLQHPIMSMQEEFEMQDTILQKRLEELLPALMEETGIDMWIVIGDEYNEGPCLRSFLPSSFFHARKTAVLIFTHREGITTGSIVSKPDFSIDRFYTPVLLKPAGFDFETFYTTFAPQYDLEAIRKMEEEDIWSCTSRIIREFNPERIALDYSRNTPFSDGLSKTNYEHLHQCVDPEFRKRFVTGEDLALRWLETRTELEIPLMQRIVETTRMIISECYSHKVITPGKTTIGEARFYLMERARTLGMIPWFDATVWIRRRENKHIEEDQAIIQPGDLLHCDFGVQYAGLCSDVQEMAYVKAEDDQEIIAQLKAIHKKAMRLQDIHASVCEDGMTGNDILTAALQKARNEGIAKPMIYSHPIGVYGHGPGPTIGSFGNQHFVSGGGERILHDATCYAMELNVREPVPSWDNLEIMYGQEIDVLFKDGEMQFFAGRQLELHIIA
ncbi:MAG: M24 family metallopeptidase [Spirochaetota bacterium]